MNAKGSRMTTPPLSPDLCDAALRHLGVAPAAPDLALLDALVGAYVQRVPWESAFRIARRAQHAQLADCPRFPDAFWRDAIERGGGGTCFESNYAFFSRLRALGFEGNLTINDMETTAACHTALVIRLDGGRWLVDVGLPLHVPVPLDATQTTTRAGAFHTYTIQPQGKGRFVVERDRHPRPYCFTLVDVPVDDAAYRAATTNDYQPDSGFFLKQVIPSKVMDGFIWRYFSDHPDQLEAFVDGEARVHPLTGDIPAALSARFGMDEATLRAALRAINIAQSA